MGIPGAHNRESLPNVLYGTLNCSRVDLTLGGGEGSVTVVSSKRQKYWGGILVIC